MSHSLWEADKILDVYIFDYLMKRKLHASARAFQLEGNVSTDPVAIDVPSGFLFEWWSVFWDVLMAKIGRKDHNHLEAALSYIEAQQIKGREMHKQQEQEHQNSNQHQKMQQLLQRHAQQQLQTQQQQYRGGTQIVRDSTTGLLRKNPLMRKDHAILNAMATKAYERLKFPFQGEALDNAPVKGMDQLCSGFLPHNALLQSPESFNQLSLQPELMLQAQQNLVDRSVNNLGSWTLKMLLDNQYMGPGKDVILNPVGDLIPSIATSTHELPDSNTSFEQQLQQSGHQVQQYSHDILSSQQSQNLKQLDKMVGAGPMPSMFQGNDQDSKSHGGQKRRQASPSGPANGCGTANTTGPSSKSPVTPTQAAEEKVSALQQNVPLPKSSLIFGSDALGSFTSAQNELESIADAFLDDNFWNFG